MPWPLLGVCIVLVASSDTSGWVLDWGVGDLGEPTAVVGVDPVPVPHYLWIFDISSLGFMFVVWIMGRGKLDDVDVSGYRPLHLLTYRCVSTAVFDIKYRRSRLVDISPV